jgi:hypothetical protein
MFRDSSADCNWSTRQLHIARAITFSATTYKQNEIEGNYGGNSVSKLQIQVATYVFELSAGNCHR